METITEVIPKNKKHKIQTLDPENENAKVKELEPNSKKSKVETKYIKTFSREILYPLSILLSPSQLLNINNHNDDEKWSSWMKKLYPDIVCSKGSA